MFEVTDEVMVQRMQQISNGCSAAAVGHDHGLLKAWRFSWFSEK
jgi:hypothetical protein